MVKPAEQELPAAAEVAGGHRHARRSPPQRYHVKGSDQHTVVHLPDNDRCRACWTARTAAPRGGVWGFPGGAVRSV